MTSNPQPEWLDEFIETLVNINHLIVAEYAFLGGTDDSIEITGLEQLRKKAIESSKQILLQKLDEAIGKEEQDPLNNPAAKDLEIFARNQLRAELRQKLGLEGEEA